MIDVKTLRILPVFALLAACGGDDEVDNLDDAKPVLIQYAQVVHESYHDSVDAAEDLKAAIDAFVAAPSQTTLDAAKAAWIAARTPYIQTEVYRFYEGPIDNAETGPEGSINGWPINEAWIDYVVGAAEGGIINATSDYPTLTAEIIRGQNEGGETAETNLTIGFHPIEFLLWGQDLNDEGFETAAGRRAFTDYTTAANADRRGEYLSIIAELLVEDLESVSEQWHLDEADSYAAEFVDLAPREGVRRILQGMYQLSASEMTDARFLVAYDTRDQEEEHSCFSDTTISDAMNDELGLENVYLGRWGSDDGAGIDGLVAARDAGLDARMKAQIAAVKAAINAIPAPFDQAILGTEAGFEDGRAKIAAAIEALRAQNALIEEIAALLGVTVSGGDA